jgi:chaperonin GroEL
MNGDITSVLTGAEARKKVRSGVNQVFNAVKLTLGPEGQNAILPRTFNRGPRLTNDGVTVSENIKPKDEHERLAADFFKEGSKKTNEMVGDGTTGTAVVAGTLMNNIFDILDADSTLAAGISDGPPKVKGARAIRKEMKDAKELVIAEIKKQAKPIKTLEDLKKIAVVSIGKEDVEISDKVAEIVWEIARDAEGNFVDNHIDTVEGYKGIVETQATKGMSFPAKVAHRGFVTNPDKFEMVAEDVPVFITNYKMDNAAEVVNLLNKLAQPKIALFSPGFSNNVIMSLAASAKQGMQCYPILCPALRTDQLEDLAIYTGATVVDKEKGKKLSNTTKEVLGYAEKLTVKDVEGREDAILQGGAKGQQEAIKERIEMLKGQAKEAKNEMTRMSIEKRIANLNAAVGVVRVGASTNAELLYLKLKIEDGVFACKAALQEGYVPGGGMCLKGIVEKLPESVLTEALKAPYNQIQSNAGGHLEIDEDVIDPARVVRLIVEHGVSVASSLITTGISVVEVRDLGMGEGESMIAKAIMKKSYFEAKHAGMLADAQDESDKDQMEAFEQAAFNDHD